MSPHRVRHRTHPGPPVARAGSWLLQWLCIVIRPRDMYTRSSPPRFPGSPSSNERPHADVLQSDRAPRRLACAAQGCATTSPIPELLQIRPPQPSPPPSTTSLATNDALAFPGRASERRAVRRRRTNRKRQVPSTTGCGPILTLATLVHAPRCRTTRGRLLKAGAKASRLHVQYRVTMALAELFRRRLASDV
jgi:hypothetical protein